MSRKEFLITGIELIVFLGGFAIILWSQNRILVRLTFAVLAVMFVVDIIGFIRSRYRNKINYESN